MIKPVLRNLIFFILFFPFCIYASEPIKIAAIFAETGIAKEGSNKQCIEAAKLTVAKLNKEGGMLGRKLQLIIIDNKSTPIGSKNAADRAVDMDVAAVIGADWSSHSIPIANVLQKAKIPMITPISTNSKVTKTGNYIFRVCFNDESQGKAIANFAYSYLKARTAIILKNIDEEYSLTLAKVFNDSFKNLGGTILFIDKYRNTSINFSTVLNKIKNNRPDVVFIPGYEKDSGLLMKQASGLGINTKFLGGDGWSGESIKDYGGDSMEGGFYSTHWHQSSSVEKTSYLKQLYRKQLGSEKKIDYVALSLTYDAIMLLADAIKRAGSADRDKIQQSLAETINYKGITGNITFDKYGDPVDKQIVFLKFKGSKPVFVKSVISEQIKIASIFAHTGPAAKHNQPSIEGVRLAVEEINKKGGIIGSDLKLIEIDNKSTPIGSKNAAQKAAQYDVTAIIGAAWSSHSLAIAQVAQKNKIPMISNISTNPNVSKIGDYIFRACFTDVFQGQVLAKFAKNYLKADSAVIFVDFTSKYSMGLSDQFEKNFKKSGGKILLKLNYKSGQEDFDKIVSQAIKEKNDIFFIPGHDESGLIIKSILKNNIKKPILGGDGWNNENFFNNGGNQLQEGYYCTHWVEDIKTQISQDFVKKHKTVTDKAALAYDAVSILKDAIERAGASDRSKIKDALAKTKNFTGVTGEISFNSNGDPIKSAVIMKIDNGEIKYLKTINP
jgi:branched-chain amino acid transport system substrate-binding protein